VYVCQGIASVVSYVHNKQRHPRVIWVNLRDDITVQCDLVTYSVRDTAALDEPVVLPAATRHDIEVSAHAARPTFGHVTFCLSSKCWELFLVETGS